MAGQKSQGMLIFRTVLWGASLCATTALPPRSCLEKLRPKFCTSFPQGFVICLCTEMADYRRAFIPSRV